MCKKCKCKCCPKWNPSTPAVCGDDLIPHRIVGTFDGGLSFGISDPDPDNWRVGTPAIDGRPDDEFVSWIQGGELNAWLAGIEMPRVVFSVMSLNDMWYPRAYGSEISDRNVWKDWPRYDSPSAQSVYPVDYFPQSLCGYIATHPQMSQPTGQDSATGGYAKYYLYQTYHQALINHSAPMSNFKAGGINTSVNLQVSAKGLPSLQITRNRRTPDPDGCYWRMTFGFRVVVATTVGSFTWLYSLGTHGDGTNGITYSYRVERLCSQRWPTYPLTFEADWGTPGPPGSLYGLKVPESLVLSLPDEDLPDGTW